MVEAPQHRRWRRGRTRGGGVERRLELSLLRRRAEVQANRLAVIGVQRDEIVLQRRVLQLVVVRDAQLHAAAAEVNDEQRRVGQRAGPTCRSLYRGPVRRSCCAAAFAASGRHNPLRLGKCCVIPVSVHRPALRCHRVGCLCRAVEHEDSPVLEVIVHTLRHHELGKEALVLRHLLGVLEPEHTSLVNIELRQ